MRQLPICKANVYTKGASGGVRSSTYYSIYKTVLKNTARMRSALFEYYNSIKRYLLAYFSALVCKFCGGKTCGGFEYLAEIGGVGKADGGGNILY